MNNSWYFSKTFAYFHQTMKSVIFKLIFGYVLKITIKRLPQE